MAWGLELGVLGIGLGFGFKVLGFGLGFGAYLGFWVLV